MKIKLLGRVADSDKFKFDSNHPSYESAVIAGQTSFGAGNFTIDTIGFVPSREQQLLQTTPTTRRRSVLDSL